MEIIETYVLPSLIFFFGTYFFLRAGIFYLKKPKKFISAFKVKENNGNFPSLRSLGVALAGTLGVGNIVGVVGAIALGGAGSVFWMWVSSFFAMMLKYAETVLAMKRRYLCGNETHGGAMYYLAPKPLGIIFAILCLICSFVLGGAIQSEALADCVESVLGFNADTICFAMAILCFIVMIGGKSGIFKASSKIVPFMSILYAIMCIAVIAYGWRRIPTVLGDIISGAFSPKAIAGGGFFLALKYGTLRGLISNEAGCGTAPIAHGASSNPFPASQGCFGIVEVFIDTVVLCTLTALAVLIFPCSKDGIDAVLFSFGVVFGDISSHLLTLSIALFAFATQICWAYYGFECIFFLFPHSKLAKGIYSLLFCASIFCLRGIGDGGLWALADLIIALMTLINLTALFKNRNVIVDETKLFLMHD